MGWPAPNDLLLGCGRAAWANGQGSASGCQRLAVCIGRRSLHCALNSHFLADIQRLGLARRGLAEHTDTLFQACKWRTRERERERERERRSENIQTMGSLRVKVLAAERKPHRLEETTMSVAEENCKLIGQFFARPRERELFDSAPDQTSRKVEMEIIATYCCSCVTPPQMCATQAASSSSLCISILLSGSLARIALSCRRLEIVSKFAISNLAQRDGFDESPLARSLASRI